MPAKSTGGQSKPRRKIPLLVLAGPTAVGKTALAVSLAQKLQTEIISADSAQVYRYLDIGTAKPTEEEQKAAPHHLIDIVDPEHVFTVADFQSRARQVIETLLQKEKLPFMVGGTGLYINAVIKNYAFGEMGISPQIREYYEKEADLRGLEKLYEKLKDLDPEAASKIHPNDRRRIIRALEVYEQEGKPISEQVARTAAIEPPYDLKFFGLYMDRATLYKRIEKRIDLMLDAGWLDEVKHLYNQGYREKDPGMQILGYRQLLTYLQGKSSWENTVTAIKKQTRNLAKRQLTWFRREKELEWIKITEFTNLDDLTENICLKVKDLLPTRAN